MEVTKRKTQSTFSKIAVWQSRQSIASLHLFFANFSTQYNATLRQPEIVSFAILQPLLAALFFYFFSRPVFRAAPQL